MAIAGVLIVALCSTWAEMRLALPGYFDVPVALAILYATRHTSQRSCLVGAAVGWIADAGGSGPMGVGMACLATAAFVVASMRSDPSRGGDAMVGLVGCVAAAAAVMSVAVVEKLVGRVELPLSMLLRQSFVAGSATAAITGAAWLGMSMFTAARRRYAY